MLDNGIFEGGGEDCISIGKKTFHFYLKQITLSAYMSAVLPVL